ncbi:MAG: NAD(P)-binding oxidoreductase [Candidatus Limnocylindrales bacterium]
MQVTILGATGRIGSLAMTEALARGYDLVLLSRRPPTEPSIEHATTIIGDVADPDVLRRALTGSAAVIAALGPRTNTLEDELALELGMRNLVAAMDAQGVTRLIALSGAAVDVPGDAKPAVDRIASRIVRLAARHVLGAKQREFDVLAASPLAWTAMRPAIVTDGAPRGYRLSERLSPGARVTRADVAAAIVAQLDDDSFVRRAPFVLPPANPDGQAPG